MKIQDEHIRIARSKAKQSLCRFRISALGFNKKGELIIKKMNVSRFARKQGGIHAEMNVMMKSGKSLKSIVICRTNGAGDILPIEPCDMCKAKADELGIKIYTIR